MFALNRKMFKLVYDEIAKLELERHENPFRFIFF